MGAFQGEDDQSGDWGRGVGDDNITKRAVLAGVQK